MNQKKCIMWSIYGDGNYFKFLDLSIRSAKLMSNNVDRVVFKDSKCHYRNDDCIVVDKEYPSGESSKMAFRYKCAAELLETYDQVLHIDTDSIVFKDVTKIFDINEPGMSIASETSTNKKYFGHIEERTDFSCGMYWAGPLLNEKEKRQYENIPSICMGAWLAQKSEISLLNSIANDVYFYESIGFRGPCLDQHAAVKNLLTSGKYNFFLQEHVNHLGLRLNNDEDFLKLKESPASIVHFAGGVQPTNEKFIKMNLFFDSI